MSDDLITKKCVLLGSAAMKIKAFISRLSRDVGLCEYVLLLLLLPCHEIQFHTYECLCYVLHMEMEMPRKEWVRERSKQRSNRRNMLAHIFWCAACFRYVQREWHCDREEKKNEIKTREIEERWSKNKQQQTHMHSGRTSNRVKQRARIHLNVVLLRNSMNWCSVWVMNVFQDRLWHAWVYAERIFVSWTSTTQTPRRASTMLNTTTMMMMTTASTAAMTKKKKKLSQLRWEAAKQSNRML